MVIICSGFRDSTKMKDVKGKVPFCEYQEGSMRLEAWPSLSSFSATSVESTKHTTNFRLSRSAGGHQGIGGHNGYRTNDEKLYDSNQRNALVTFVSVTLFLSAISEIEMIVFKQLRSYILPFFFNLSNNETHLVICNNLEEEIYRLMQTCYEWPGNIRQETCNKRGKFSIKHYISCMYFTVEQG